MEFVDPGHGGAAAAACRGGRGRRRLRRLVARLVVGGDRVPVGRAGRDRGVRVAAAGQQRAVEGAEGARRRGRAVHGVAGQVRVRVVGPVQVDRAGDGRRQQARGRRRGRRVARAAAAVVHEDAGHPLGVVDERVAVALVGVDRVVAGAFLVVDGIVQVPLQHRREQAHVGDAQVGAGVRALDQRQAVGQDQVGLGVAGHAVRAALVAHVHVQQGAGHVAAPVPPRLPVGGVAPVRPPGIGAAAAADAVHELRRVLGRRAADDAVRLVVAGRVVAVVADEQVVAVGVGVVARAVVGEAEALAPDVFAIVVEVARAVLREAGVQVHVQHAAAVGRVGVGGLDHDPGVGAGGRVGDLGVVVDRRVHGRAQRGRGRRVHRVVVAGRDALVEGASCGRLGSRGCRVVGAAAEEGGQDHQRQNEEAKRGAHPGPPAGEWLGDVRPILPARRPLSNH